MVGPSMQRGTSKHQPFNAIRSGSPVAIALYPEVSAKVVILSFEGPQVDLTFFRSFVGINFRTSLSFERPNVDLTIFMSEL